MRNYAYSLFYLALIGFVSTIIVNLLHIQGYGAIIFILSCFFMLTGGFIFLFSSPKLNIKSLSPRAFNVHVISNTLFFEGTLFLVLGVLLKLAHWGGGGLLVKTGILMNLIFFIILPYKFSKWNK